MIFTFEVSMISFYLIHPQGKIANVLFQGR
jgi:hypothetical protein